MYPNDQLSQNHAPTDDPVSAPGTEYNLLLVVLLAAAAALVGLLLSLVYGLSSMTLVALPMALLVVTVPAAYILSLRIDRLERKQPQYIFSRARLRSAQFAQVASFCAVILSVMLFVYTLFVHLADFASSLSVGRAAIAMLIVLAVFGGLFAFYWRSDHAIGRPR